MRHIFCRFVLWMGALALFSPSGVSGPSSFEAVRTRGYTSATSVQGLFEFDGYVYVKAYAEPPQDYVRAHIEYQLWSLLGGLKAAAKEGGPLMDHEISLGTIVVDPSQKDRYRVNYHYKGTVIFEKSMSQGSHSMRFPLPIDPTHIYDPINAAASNHCVVYTDYATDHYFFYFWNPYLPNCPLLKGRDYDEFDGQFTPYPNTNLSFPDYDRLAGKNGEISVSILFGLNSISSSTDPYAANNRDLNADNYQRTKASLMKMGFSSRRYGSQDFVALGPAEIFAASTVEEFFKDYKNGKRIRARLFFGNSDFDSDSAGFHYFFKDSIERASVLIYVGHSGMGGNLGVGEIEKKRGFKILPAHDQYQIFAFHGCSSYAYYTQAFFGFKSWSQDPIGTKNLDIIANGIVASFPAGIKTTSILLGALDDWSQGKSRMSYQQLASALEDHALLGISGDADNPK